MKSSSPSFVSCRPRPFEPRNQPGSYRPRRQRGYALLMIMFFVALLVATAMTVVPNVLTEGKRQNEEEMIWRGKQYIRGISLYYRKLGKYPTSLDDLTKPQIGNIRFMRAAYKDPMNKVDGSWRLIYIGPAGQLIGSLKPQPNLGVPGAPGFGTPAGTVAGASTGPFAATGSQASFAPSGGFGAPIAGGAAFGNPGAAGAAVGADGQPVDPASDPMLNPPAGAGTDLPDIIGGNITGVGSKINQHSIMVYQKAKNYLLFEFVWNPAQAQANALQQLNAPGTGGIGTPVGNTPNPFGPTPATNGPGAGASPPVTAPSTPPQQPPQ
jgi:hypothetical protein